jgi:hypothetical protein
MKDPRRDAMTAPSFRAPGSGGAQNKYRLVFPVG